jgi:hypothetical protein
VQVRQALAQGRLDLVEQWLDRPYAVIVHLPAISNAPTRQQSMQCGFLLALVWRGQQEHPVATACCHTCKTSLVAVQCLLPTRCTK